MQCPVVTWFCCTHLTMTPGCQSWCVTWARPSRLLVSACRWTSGAKVNSALWAPCPGSTQGWTNLRGRGAKQCWCWPARRAKGPTNGPLRAAGGAETRGKTARGEKTLRFPASTRSPPRWAASTPTIYKAALGSVSRWCNSNRGLRGLRELPERYPNSSAAFTSTASRRKVWDFWLNWPSSRNGRRHRPGGEERWGSGGHPGFSPDGCPSSQEGHPFQSLQARPWITTAQVSKTVGKWSSFGRVFPLLPPALRRAPPTVKWTGSSDRRRRC